MASRFDAGRARLAIDSRELAEDPAGMDVPERHLLAGLGIDRGPDLASRKEVHRAAFVLVTHNRLTRLEIAPDAAAGQGAPRLGRQRSKDFNAIQRVVMSLHPAVSLTARRSIC